MSDEEAELGLEEITEPPGSVIELGAAPVQIHVSGEQEAQAPAIELVDFGFVEALMQTIHELQSHPRVVSVDVEVGTRVPPFNLDTMEHGLGRVIPPVLRSLYEQLDGVSVSWTWRDDAGQVRPGGQIQLSDFATMFGPWFDRLWEHRDDMDEEALDVLWSLRGLEAVTTPDGRLEIAAVSFDPATALEPPLYLYRPGQALVPWWGGVMDYLYAMLDARGVYGWQRLLSDYDFLEDPWATEGADAFFEVMRVMFPEEELGVWRQRLRAQGINDER